MIITVLTQIETLGNDKELYTVHKYDDCDLTNLIPTSSVELVTAQDLKTYCMHNRSQCSNFTLNGQDELILPKNLQKRLSATSEPQIPYIQSDDVWNFLWKLRESDSMLIIPRDEYQHGAFTDDKKTYMISSKNLQYSTKHANCSIHLLIDGTVYNCEDDSVHASKRWSTYKIVKDNKLLKRYLTVITTQEGLDFLRKDSKVEIKTVSVSGALNLPPMSITESSDELYYSIIDLYSLPFVCTNSVLTSNFNMMHNFTQTYNHTSMLGKVCKAFLQELASRDSAVLNLYESDEFYREKAIYDKDEEKTNGVKFTISGQASIPSVNACIKALKKDNVKSVSDMLDLDTENLESLSNELYRLNILQQSAIRLLLHLCKEYNTTKNPIISYDATSTLCKFYLRERELYKARLTYVRSVFMMSIPSEVFIQNKSFSNETNGATVFIEFGQF